MRHHVARLLAPLALALAAGAAATPLRAQDAGRTAAAADLLQAMNIERVMVGAMNATLSAQVAANPAMAPYQDVVQAWAKKYLTWEAMGPELTRMYAETFSEAELRELSAFYRTPTGQKSLVVMPELMQKGSSAGLAIAQAHMAELQQMVLERKRQLEQKPTPP